MSAATLPLTSAPAWDATLWKAANRLTNDPEVANAMTVYECRWLVGEKRRWGAAQTRLFLEAEDRLLNAIRR